MKAQKGDIIKVNFDRNGLVPENEYEVIDRSNLTPFGVIVINEDGFQHHISDSHYKVVKSSLKWGDPVAVRDLDCEEWTQAIYVAKDPTHDGHIVMIPDKDEFSPEWFNQCKKRTTVTKQEIADWKNVPVELLNIES